MAVRFLSLPAVPIAADRLRAVGILLHRWLGLVVGFVFALVGLTGSVIAFGPELLAWGQPALAAPAPGGWEAARASVLARTLAAHRPGEVTLVRFPGGALGAYEIYLADESLEYRHALSGDVLHRRPAMGDTVLISRELHTHLAGGERGEQLLGWLGVAMLVLLGTGLWLWWPRGGRWRLALRYPATRQLRPQLYWWHKSGGIVTFVLLAFVTLTGVAMLFHGAAQALLTGMLGGRAPELPGHVAPADEIDWHAVLATLDRTLPSGRAVFFAPPRTNNAPLVFRKRLPAELHPNGRSFVLLDGEGRRVAAHDASAAATGLRATNAIYPLHAGRTGARWWQLTVAVSGILPAVLFATGFWLWRGRASAGRATRE